MERELVPGVHDHGAAYEDGGGVVADGIEDRLALGPVAAGGEADEQAGVEGGVDRGAGAVGDGAVGGEQGAVEVDRDHAIGHWSPTPPIAARSRCCDGAEV